VVCIPGFGDKLKVTHSPPNLSKHRRMSGSHQHQFQVCHLIPCMFFFIFASGFQLVRARTLQCFLSPVCWIPSSIVFLATTPILFWPPLSLEFCGGSVNVVFFPFHGLQSGKGVSVVFFWFSYLTVGEWCVNGACIKLRCTLSA
jgi:hypothetical protein